MVPKSIIVFVILTFLLIADAKATPPSTNLRNIEFNVDVDSKPEKIGNIFEISWNFTLNEETDSIFRAFCLKEDSLSTIKAYLNVYPEQKYVTGDSVWSGGIEYGATHSFSATYQIITYGKISCSPHIEIYKELKGELIRLSKNRGRGFVFHIKDTSKATGPVSHFEIIGNDTITTTTGIDIPKEFMTVDTNDIEQR